ncbi:MAG: threonine synthase [Coriobacteriia bacterium]
MRGMPEMRYRDTRGLDDSRPAFTDVVIEGIAKGGGLYVPETVPSLPLSRVVELADLPYHSRAARVFRHFGVDVDWEGIVELMHQAYGRNFDHPAIAPVVEVRPDTHVLELWHGPTSAFKDMALQCMPLFFSEAVTLRRLRGGPVEDYLILVATSGDTGKAALAGFAGRAHTRIAVFYPESGVSDIQRLQMVTQEGDNVAVFGVAGNFDDCQAAVKAAFNDTEFAQRLHREWRLRLSSANSINWGRLLPQVVYYVSAYADMVSSGGVRPGETMDVCVPTGNFGNILGAYYAKRLGVPIGRLLCASNANNVLTDFINTGEYDISQREFVRTPSPSMDILVSSNLERLLFELTQDAEAVRGWAQDLAESGRFRVDKDTFRAIRDILAADWVSNDDSLAAIKRVFDETGYLMDPHTAVGWEVAQRLRGDAPVLVVSTAHWAKFAPDVYRALSGISYGEPLPQGDVPGPRVIEMVQELASDKTVPKGLAGLDRRPVRFTDVVEGDVEGIESAVLGWLS